MLTYDTSTFFHSSLGIPQNLSLWGRGRASISFITGAIPVLNNKLPLSGTIFISVNDSDKNEILKIARDLDEMDYKIIATKGTAEILLENGVNCKTTFKVGEGRPNIVDHIKKYLLDKRDDIDHYELEDADLKRFNPLYWKKERGKVVEGLGPTLYAKLIYSKKSN